MDDEEDEYPEVEIAEDLDDQEQPDMNQAPNFGQSLPPIESADETQPEGEDEEEVQEEMEEQEEEDQGVD